MSDVKKQASKMLAEEIIHAIKKLTADNNKQYVNPQIRNYRFTIDNLPSDIKQSITDIVKDTSINQDAIDEAIKDAISNATIDSAQIIDLEAKIAEITVLEVERATIDTAQIENLYATVADIIYLSAEKAQVGDLEAQKITSAIADLGLANIGSADIDFAQIKDLVSNTAIIREGLGGKLYIDRLAVTDAQILSLTTGELVIQGQDGLLYTVYVDDEGNIQTKLRVVTGSDIANGTINGSNIAENTITGALITEHAITARELNVSQIFASDALIGAIKAGNIDVADLSANEAFIGQLITSLIKAPNFGSELDISNNASIELTNKRIGLIVSSESNESELVLTDGMLRAITDQIHFVADDIDFSANDSINFAISSTIKNEIADLDDPIVQDTVAPTPEFGLLWLDLSQTPNVLKRWNGFEWTIVNDVSWLQDDLQDVQESIVTINSDLSIEQGRISALTERIETTESDISGLSVGIDEAKAVLTPEGLNAIVERCDVIKDINGDLIDVSSSIADVSVTADKIYWLIKGNSSSSAITLTESAIEAISGTITLTAEQINAIANEIDLSGNTSIKLMVSSTEEKVLARSNVHRGETPPLDANINDLWVIPSTGYTYQLTSDDGESHPTYYADENGILYYNYETGQQEYVLYMDDAGDLYISEDATYAVAISQDGTPSVWVRVKDSELENAAQAALEAAQRAQEKANQNAEDMAEVVTQFESEFSSLQSQIDGNITSWFEYGVPTASNYPASEWTTADLKNAHLGDLYYNRNTGYCYRWQLSGNTYSWTRISDTDVTKALNDAAEAKDVADNKRRVFVTTPVPPYDIGDLWVQGSAGDIMRCQTTRTSGSYYASDWVKASKYTDDTKANQNAALLAQQAIDMANIVTEFESEFSSLQSQVDGHISTWFEYGAPTTSNYPANQWTTTDLKSAHQGDLYYDRNTGHCYRWYSNGSTYSWMQIVDEDVTQALEDAATAKDVADSKRRVFVATPSPPYEIGDLWVQGSAGDIMRCKTARASGSYYASDWVKASKYTDDTLANQNAAQIAQQAIDMGNIVTQFESEFSSLQSQVDGHIATWFEYGVPTYSNYPASQWTTNTLRSSHQGDLYYDRNTGYCYRWQSSGSTYVWTQIIDKDVTQALTDAAEAKDVADNKRRVFVATPTPPYDIGDLWVQGTNGDIMRCQTTRSSGSYYASDWVKASKYTDDTKANQNAQIIAQHTATLDLLDDRITARVEQSISSISGELETQIGTSFSEINQTVNELRIEMGKNREEDKEELRTYLRYADGTVELGRSGSRYVSRTSDNGFMVLQDGEVMTSIVQNTISAPVVQADRTFQLGNFAFRLGASGHLILV